MERRVEQADRHRQAAHRLEDPVEVGLLERQQPVESRAAPGLGVREDHLLHHGQPLDAEEHVLGAAEADPLRAELTGADRIGRVVAVRANLQAPVLVGPGEDRLEVVVQLGRDELDLADVDIAAAAVDRDHVALVQLVAAEPDDTALEREPLATGDARGAHASRDDRRVRGHAAVHGQDSLRGDHPVDVVGRRLVADEDHGPALCLLDRRVGVEHDRAARRARARVEPLRHGLRRGVGVDSRMEELVELRGVDPHHCVLLRDHALLDHLDGRLERGRGGALGGARLQHVEDVVLDGELDVLDVSVVLLESPHRCQKLLVGRGHDQAHRLHRLGRTDAGDDVLALSVGQELAEDLFRAGRRVARERDPRARAVALVAEDHLHDVDCGADVVRDVVGAAVDLSARRVPGVEDPPDGAHQLVGRLRREVAALLLAVDAVEGLHELGEIRGGQIGVLGDAPVALQRGQSVLEAVAPDPVDDLAEHLDQAPVGVVGEPRIARSYRESLDRVVVQAQVEDRVHHPRHRDRRTGAHGHEEGIGMVAEALPGLLLQPPHVLADLGLEPVRQVLRLHVGAAGVGRDREARRDRKSQRGHLRKPDSLAAEKLASAVGRLVEVEHKARRSGHRSDCYHARPAPLRGKPHTFHAKSLITRAVHDAWPGTRRARPASAIRTRRA